MARLFTLLADNPARLLDVNAGALGVGREADLILIDPNTPWQIDAQAMSARAGNTPFDGLPVQGRALGVWKGGTRVA
jgi:dihydroorotase